MRMILRHGPEPAESGARGARQAVEANTEQGANGDGASCPTSEGTGDLKPKPESAQTDHTGPVRTTPDAAGERSSNLRLKPPRMKQTARARAGSSRSTSPDKFSVALGGVSRSARPSFPPSSSLALSSPRPAPSKSEVEGAEMLKVLS